MLYHLRRSQVIDSGGFACVENVNMAEIKRYQLAKRLNVHPNTILNWEKRGVAPVVPMRNPRTRKLFYSEDDVPKYQEWMNKLVPATFGEPKSHGDTPVSGAEKI
jgi:hypothetical protein